MRHLLGYILFATALSHGVVGLALDNPMQPPTGMVDVAPVPAAAAPVWRLSSTLVAADRQVAVINDRAVALGEAINGATLVAVKAKTATLRYRGQQIVLHLPGAEAADIVRKIP